jgi:hypothetical protein
LLLNTYRFQEGDIKQAVQLFFETGETDLGSEVFGSSNTQSHQPTHSTTYEDDMDPDDDDSNPNLHGHASSRPPILGLSARTPASTTPLIIEEMQYTFETRGNVGIQAGKLNNYGNIYVQPAGDRTLHPCEYLQHVSVDGAAYNFRPSEKDSQSHFNGLQLLHITDIQY